MQRYGDSRLPGKEIKRIEQRGEIEKRQPRSLRPAPEGRGGMTGTWCFACGGRPPKSQVAKEKGTS